MLATNLHDQAERLTVDQRSTDPAGTINDRDGDLMPPKHKSGKNDQTQKQRICYPGNARLQHYKLGGQGLNRGDIALNRYLSQHAVDECIGNWCRVKPPVLCMQVLKDFCFVHHRITPAR